MLLRTKKVNHQQRTSPISMPMPTMPMKQSFPLLLIFSILLLAKQSEQRILPKRSAAENTAKEMMLGDEEPNVFLPLHSPLDYSTADEQDEEMPQINPSISHRLANVETKFVARQLAEAAGLEEFFRPRPQRWLLRTKTLKEHPIPLNSNDGGDGLQFAVKRVVSESELNSLLKNAWLGRK